MNQSQQLAFDLRTLLLRYPNTLWPSESDSPIEVVTIPWYRLFSWKREKDSYETHMLNMAAQSGDAGLAALAGLMMQQKQLVSFRRKTKNTGQYTLYILTRFGRFNYVGIRTQLIET